ncbi:MAG: CmpA/NrtA family ABC transporter substrate-binding protein [Verrucomicrobiota bacterium]
MAIAKGQSVINGHTTATRRARVRSLTESDTFRIGFVPMIDCAPVVVAYELGLFDKFGVSCQLSREIGWASVRDRLLHQELHAAHAPAAMAFALRCGLGSLAVPCLSAMILAYGGSSITLSSELREQGVVDDVSFGDFVRANRGRRKFRFAAVFQYSTQHYNLRNWLVECGLDPVRDVEIVLMPSPLVHRSLAAGHIDGFCVAEPWNSTAEEEGSGWLVRSNLAPTEGQVEKVFLVIERFEREFRDQHLAMVRALQEAAVFCERAEFRSECIRILSGAAYLDTPIGTLKKSLGADIGGGVGAIRFGAGKLGVPTRDRGIEVYKMLSRIGVPEGCRGFRRDIIPKLFREDLYTRAAERLPFYPPAEVAFRATPVNPLLEDPDRSRAA